MIDIRTYDDGTIEHHHSTAVLMTHGTEFNKGDWITGAFLMSWWLLLIRLNVLRLVWGLFLITSL